MKIIILSLSVFLISCGEESNTMVIERGATVTNNGDTVDLAPVVLYSEDFEAYSNGTTLATTTDWEDLP